MKSRLVKKKLQDVLSRERGAEKKVWGRRLAVCLAYPNSYRVGMSNLGFQAVYRIINDHPLTLCERVFLPEGLDRASHPGGGGLYSLESQRPLKDFDIVAFSISYEGDYPNVLTLLTLAGIEMEREKRSVGEPLIIGGGVAVTLNPEPLGLFFDLFLIGEAEEMLPEFLAAYQRIKDDLSRRESLLSLQREVAGVYVPACYEQNERGQLIPIYADIPPRIKKRTAYDLNAFNTTSSIIPEKAEFQDMYLVEVNRGCPRGCRFCAAGYLYRPTRFRSLSTLERALDRGLMEQNKVGLIGTAVSDHPELIKIGRYLLNRGGKMAIGSLRADRITREIVELVKEGGVETVALAPEAGTDRLRQLLKKDISEERILEAVEALITGEIFQIRLYFMIGLPTETDGDIEGIVELVKKVQHVARRSSAGQKPFKRITLSINQFIPKPVTPFQWFPLEETSTIKTKLARICKAFRRDPTVVVIHDLPKWNYLHALFSLGDRQVGKLLLAAHHLGGNWSQVFKGSRLNPDYYVYRQKGLEEVLPWEIIDHGISRELLMEEYRRACSFSDDHSCH